MFFFKKKLKGIYFANDLNLFQINKLKKTKNLKSSLFIIISKSGNTIEILSIIDSLKSKANFNSKNFLLLQKIKTAILQFCKQT